ncbi:hypothetical protein GG344DRAFT_84690 [Lentinula edodes]|nr:hypothetical protein GG344DRAFT_84690 [Lentinula edodes]
MAEFWLNFFIVLIIIINTAGRSLESYHSPHLSKKLLVENIAILICLGVHASHFVSRLCLPVFLGISYLTRTAVVPIGAGSINLRDPPPNHLSAAHVAGIKI